MFFEADSNYIRYTGRWNITEKSAITTAPGGMIEFMFSGEFAVLHFDIETNQQPYPHLWIIVDNGAKVEVPLEQYLRIECSVPGAHHVKIIFKGAVEMQHRWYQPLIGKVSFCGFEVENAEELPEDNRKIIEYIGDSITEGVLIDAMYNPNIPDQLNRVYQDDVTATYAWLTAENLNLRPVIMGYGATGFLTDGQGAVPRAIEAYPYCYNGVPYNGSDADVIVINYAVNDRLKPAEEYINAYVEFLKLVRCRNPKAMIVTLSPFYGVYEKEMREMVTSFNKENGDNIIFISTEGWIPQKPFHPLREGHKIVSEKLTEKLREYIKN